MQPRRIEPGPGQESVWDYPRPPAVAPTDAHVRVEHRRFVLADTHRAVRVLETSQPPAFYVPSDDVTLSRLRPSPTRTVCEWKGVAVYWSFVDDDVVVHDVAWSYPSPNAPYAAITDHLAFYPQRVDACWVDDERVAANPGDFYGGWITSKVVGPFKGAAGTLHW
ncbi:MAG: DUF427 domain-containing protein [Acidimicrobiia bacterium]